MSADKPKIQFIILHETVLRAWLRDASTFALFAALIGAGVAVGSSAMQWAGFFIAVVVSISRASSIKAKRMTRDEAITYLNSEDAP